MQTTTTNGNTESRQLTCAAITEHAFQAINELKLAWEKTTEKTAHNADLFHNRAYGVFVLWNELTESRNVATRMDLMRLVDEIPEGWTLAGN